MKNGSDGIQHTVDQFRITKGALGPVPKCSLDIKPLTLFVGPQGSGKSLVAQLLYFFEELPYLATLAAGAENGGPEWDAQELVRYLLDGLRSSDRAFGTFANPNVVVDWRRGTAFESLALAREAPLSFNAQSSNRQIKPTQALREFLRAVANLSHAPQRHALFVPTERLLVSQLRRALSGKLLNLPLTYTLFSDWLDWSASVLAGTRPADLPPAAQWIAGRAKEALNGTVVRHGNQWKWSFGSPARQFDIDLASSGQRANWTIPYLAQALLVLQAQKSISKRFTIFVEEPEMHLHPTAQCAMVEVLASLVHLGIRVVVTTHSLTVLYAVNNLVQAAQLGNKSVAGVPEPRLRISAQDVAVYAFEEGVAPRSLVEPESGFIDEAELGRTAEDLAHVFNLTGMNLPRGPRTHG